MNILFLFFQTAADAATPEEAEEGMLFMQDMIEFAKTQHEEGKMNFCGLLATLDSPINVPACA